MTRRLPRTAPTAGRVGLALIAVALGVLLVSGSATRLPVGGRPPALQLAATSPAGAVAPDTPPCLGAVAQYVVRSHEATRTRPRGPVELALCVRIAHLLGRTFR